MQLKIVGLLFLILLFAFASPVFAEKGSDRLTITSADENLSMTFGGRFQLRYELEMDDFNAEHSSFYLRRLQPDLRGEAFGGDLSFRLMPDLSRQASLRDGWVSYRFSRALQVRAGQFTVPFNWERHAPPTRHQFVERSAANDQFQVATGRDIGVMVHGNPVDRFHYGVGIFSGQGINARLSETTGHLISGRAIFAILGEYPLTEILLEPVQELNLAIGAGGYVAIDNTARVEFGEGADVLATTGDLHLQIWRLSLHLASFVWTVDGEDSFPGFGHTGQLGVLIIPERLLAALRYSESELHFDLDAAWQREGLVGVQIFHRGNDSKFHLEVGQRSIHDGQDWQDGQVFRVQYQFLF